MPWAEERSGPFIWARMHGASCSRRGNAGVRLDAPVEQENPWLGSTRSRQDATGVPAGGWYRTSVSRSRKRCRRSHGRQRRSWGVGAGVIRVGASADFVVDRDPFAIPATELAVRTLATIVAGRVVWRAEQPPARDLPAGWRGLSREWFGDHRDAVDGAAHRDQRRIERDDAAPGVRFWYRRSACSCERPRRTRARARRG